MRTVAIGLIGDPDPQVAAHRAIPLALRDAGAALQVGVAARWVPTASIASDAGLEALEGLWCVPASPYRSMDGALRAIGHARRNGVPFLGTCGGFQHAVLEYARNVLGWADADHAETAPAAARAVIAPLACGLVEESGRVRLFAGTRIAAAHGAAETAETYHCRYGLNPEFRAALVSGPLRAVADDAAGDVRAVELDAHPFFVATLFQPERAALAGRPVPLAAALLSACVARRHATERS